MSSWNRYRSFEQFEREELWSNEAIFGSQPRLDTGDLRERRGPAGGVAEDDEDDEEVTEIDCD